MEVDVSSAPSTLDAIALQDGAGASASSSSSTSHPSSSSVTASASYLHDTHRSSSSVHPAGDEDDADDGAPFLLHRHPHGGPWGNQSFLGLVVAKLWHLQTWLVVHWQALVVRSRLGQSASGSGPKRSTTETLVVKQYAYPTHWLKLACLSLVAVQFIMFQHFQVARMDLHVKECVFHADMMRAVMVSSDGAIDGVPKSANQNAATSNAAVLRYLERRVEQLSAPPQAKNDLNLRRPWACVAIVSAGARGAQNDEARDKRQPLPQCERVAEDLQMLLPRGEVVRPNKATLASRLQLVISDGEHSIGRRDHGGVLATLFPLSSFRDALFTRDFPDIIVAQTEFALRRFLDYRHDRQEEYQHRIAQRKLHERDDAKDPSDAINAEREYERSKTQFGVLLLKTTVPDIYDRRVRKNWDGFLHVVVTSESDREGQYTKELLTLWKQHPEWPTLHVRFAHSDVLCGSFLRLVTTSQQLTDDEGEIIGVRANGGIPDNIDLTCEAQANSRGAIVRLKNELGVHLFPVAPEVETHEDMILESASAGAIVVTYNTPVMREWIPDACGIRVGSYEIEPAANGKLFDVPVPRVTTSDIEHAIESLLRLDHIHRVAAGRAARVHYLSLRTHFLSAVAALDNAMCSNDGDEDMEPQGITQRSRKVVNLDIISSFLH
ncbi:hypothetical protein PINS_up006741 [Pythium insidiosum]|nr:hypothetical protein PINS_up006741 [Pythium insidiosum]